MTDRRGPGLAAAARRAALGLAAMLGLVLGCAAASGDAIAAKPTSAEGAVEGPYDLAFPDADGTNQPFAQWKGKVLVVNFWATWCAPCVAEMPELEKMQREFGRRGVVIVGLGTENAAQVRKFRDHQHLSLKLLSGGFDAMSIARNWGDHQGVLPYTAVFSADGKFLHSQVGPIVAARLRGWLNAALVGPPAHR